MGESQRIADIRYIDKTINTKQLTDADRMRISSYIASEIGLEKITEKGRRIALFFNVLSDDNIGTIATMIRDAIVKNKITINLVLENI